jgi:hypothetical protein
MQKVGLFASDGLIKITNDFLFLETCSRKAMTFGINPVLESC